MHYSVHQHPPLDPDRKNINDPSTSGRNNGLRVLEHRLGIVFTPQRRKSRVLRSPVQTRHLLGGEGWVDVVDVRSNRTSPGRCHGIDDGSVHAASKLVSEGRERGMETYPLTKLNPSAG
jgi:hypothetical protein